MNKNALSANSEIAATVMVDFSFNMGTHYAKKIKIDFCAGKFWANFPTPDKKLGQTRFSHQKFKATLTLPSFMIIQPIEERRTVLRR